MQKKVDMASLKMIVAKYKHDAAVLTLCKPGQRANHDKVRSYAGE